MLEENSQTDQFLYISFHYFILTGLLLVVAEILIRFCIFIGGKLLFL